MICPVGLKEVTGKLPMEVAIAISGQLVELYQSKQTKQPNQQGAQWKSLANHLKFKGSPSINSGLCKLKQTQSI